MLPKRFGGLRLRLHVGWLAQHAFFIQAGAVLAVAEAVQVMEISQERSQHTVQETGKISHSLDGVVAAVDTINDMNLQIATAAEEQHAVTEEISRNLENIQHIVQDLSSAAIKSEQTTQEMASAGKALQDLIKQFRY